MEEADVVAPATVRRALRRRVAVTLGPVSSEGAGSQAGGMNPRDADACARPHFVLPASRAWGTRAQAPSTSADAEAGQGEAQLPQRLPLLLPFEWYERERFTWMCPQPVCLTVEVDGRLRMTKYAAVMQMNEVSLSCGCGQASDGTQAEDGHVDGSYGSTLRSVSSLLSPASSLRPLPDRYDCPGGGLR